MVAAVLLTIILECLVLYLLKEREKMFFVYWGALTAFTNLSANLFIALTFNGGTLEYWHNVVIIELIVFLLEFILCFVYLGDLRKSALYSLVCNLTSFLIGLIIF